jgi:hypothetical protein
MTPKTRKRLEAWLRETSEEAGPRYREGAPDGCPFCGASEQEASECYPEIQEEELREIVKDLLKHEPERIQTEPGKAS